MSNGESLDGFVFPPFIPTAAQRPADAPPAPSAPAPQSAPPAAPPLQAAPPVPPAAEPGRMTMPWDVETPIVRDAPSAPSPAEAEAESAGEDLPWLEVPTPRPAAPEAAPPAETTAAAAPAEPEVFPDWMAWDDRDASDASGELGDIAPVAGLEDFGALDMRDVTAEHTPSVGWAEAEPELDTAPNVAGPASGAVPPMVFEATPDPMLDPALDLPSPGGAPPLFAATEFSFDDAPAAEPAPLFDAAAEPGIDTAESMFDTAPFAPEADDLSFGAPAPAEAPAIPSPAEAPSVQADPFVADAEAVIAAEPDPFTAASVAEAEAATPAEVPAATAAAGHETGSGAFADVAARLEEIARTLRERPDALMSGAANDPLALLVAGYVMGYGARR